jgi:RNA polymerase sigma factor (TIGR02999 family)
MATAPGDITQLLAEARQGNPGAESRLVEIVYSQLHAMARRYMTGERSDHTLQPTVLVHEAFMRLVRSDTGEWSGRTHFFSVAAVVMRRILIDHARQVRAAKRGSGGKLSLDAGIHIGDEMSEELIALDEALDRLAQLDPRQCRVVELRFFSGLSEEEIAALLDVTPRTVRRDWKTARAWLHSQIAGTSA